jgi:predicted transcriptional regulator
MMESGWHGDDLRRWRCQMGSSASFDGQITQVEAAELLGVSTSAVVHWENGQRAIPLIVRRFCERLLCCRECANEFDLSIG